MSAGLGDVLVELVVLLGGYLALRLGPDGLDLVRVRFGLGLGLALTLPLTLTLTLDRVDALAVDVDGEADKVGVPVRGLGRRSAALGG